MTVNLLKSCYEWYFLCWCFQETTETAPSEDQQDYTETFSFSDSETVVSSHDGRAGAEELSSDPDNSDTGTKSQLKQKGRGSITVWIDRNTAQWTFFSKFWCLFICLFVLIKYYLTGIVDDEKRSGKNANQEPVPSYGFSIPLSELAKICSETQVSWVRLIAWNKINLWINTFKTEVGAGVDGEEEINYYWLTDKLTDWLTDFRTCWLDGWLIDQPTEWLTDWQTDCLIVWLSHVCLGCWAAG